MSRLQKYVIDNFDWRTYLEKYYDIKYAKGNSEYRICCFNCGDTKHKLYVNVDKGIFNCFKCDFSCKNYNVFDFVSKTEHISRGTAVLKLLQEYQPTTPEELELVFPTYKPEERITNNLKRIQLPEEAVPLSESNKNNYKVFWEYLYGRGLTFNEITNQLNIHIIPQRQCAIYNSKKQYKGNIGRRLIWPIYKEGQLVSWQARAIHSGVTSKYLNCPDADSTQTLWPYVKPLEKTVILTEGVLDSLAVRRNPNYSAYATFSKNISKDQVNILKYWGVQEVILFWDKRDAMSQMENAAERLKIYFKVSVPNFSNWPTNLDCGDCLNLQDGQKLLGYAVDNAISVDSLDYLKWRIT